MKMARSLPKCRHRPPADFQGHKSIVKDMRKKSLCALIVTALLISMPLAPLAQSSASKAAGVHEVDASTYLVDIASNAPSMEGAYPSETKKIVATPPIPRPTESLYREIQPLACVDRHPSRR